MKTLMEKYLTGHVDPVNETEDEYLSDLMGMVFEFLDTVKLDELSDEQYELFEDILDMYDSDKELNEYKKERVIRGGKRVKKLKCPEGKKAVNGKCVRMTSTEKRVRSKAAKRSAKKKKGQKASIQRKRKKSMRKRA